MEVFNLGNFLYSLTRKLVRLPVATSLTPAPIDGLLLTLTPSTQKYSILCAEVESFPLTRHSGWMDGCTHTCTHIKPYYNDNTIDSQLLRRNL